MAKKLYKDGNGNDVWGYDLELKIETEGKGLKENEIEIIGSTSVRDRDEEVIDLKGIDLKNYKNNPIILPAHDYTQPAIGRAVKVRKTDGKLMFKIEFPEDGINPMADIYRKLYKGGFMKASSIGFIPKKWEWGKGDKDPRRTFSEVELLELSLVSVPANPQALLTAKGIQGAIDEGIITEDDIQKAENFDYKKDADPDDDKPKEEAPKEDNPMPEEPKKEDAPKEKPKEEEAEKAMQDIIAKTIKQVIDALIEKGVLSIENEEHYSKLLFADPEPQTPKGEATEKPTLSNKDILGAVKEGLEGV